MTDCRKIEELVGCYTDAAGVHQNVVIHNVVDKDGVVIATYYLDSAGSPINTTGGTVVPGSCVAEPVALVGNGFQIAGATRAATPAFNGAPSNFDTSSIAGYLQSITVTAFATTAGLPGTVADQVIVALPGGNKIALSPGETRTWSVVRDQDIELKREYSVDAVGSAYATISWTVV
ncbi:MAG: hypothetical protein WAS51_14440 [Ilumatobacteraceae bacterium]